MTLRAKFPNPQHQLLPGMYTKARIMQGTQEKAIVVPQQAITLMPVVNPSHISLINNKYYKQEMLKY
ncbi:hypothetical protein ACU42Y_04810 [Proteus mirabilis]